MDYASLIGIPLFFCVALYVLLRNAQPEETPEIGVKGGEAGSAEPLQMTIGLSDGNRLFAVRYASGPVVNSLHVSTDVASIRLLYPEAERLAHFPVDAHVVVSEPLVGLPGVWREVPAGTALVVDRNTGERLDEQPFRPEPPR